jgi:hypothetical protein
MCMRVHARTHAPARTRTHARMHACARMRPWGFVMHANTPRTALNTPRRAFFPLGYTLPRIII